MRNIFLEKNWEGGGGGRKRKMNWKRKEIEII